MIQKSAMKGRLIMTNYKVVFTPEDKRVYAVYNIHTEYFNVPLGLISKYLFSLEGSAVWRRSWTRSCT